MTAFPAQPGEPLQKILVRRRKNVKRCLQNGEEMIEYGVISSSPQGALIRERMTVRMNGYNDKRRKLFVRVTAGVLAVLMIATVFSALIFR